MGKRIAVRAPLAAAVAVFGLSVGLAEARITKVEIKTDVEAFGGYSWPGVGKYRKLVGVAHGEVNPTDRRNAVIVDIGLAPRNARGNVEYSFNFYILKPEDLSKGAHRVMYEPPNRGGKTWNALGRVVSGPGGANDPGSIIDETVLRNSFLMPRGYTMVWSGWEDLGPLDGLVASLALPVAKNADGSSISGPSYEYIVSGARGITISYPALDYADKTTATLTHRVHLDDQPKIVPASNWRYYPDGIPATATLPAIPGPAIGLVNPATGAAVNFINNDIYEFSYVAKDPTVNGLGFAAVRDWNAWLRYETQDDYGNPNPLAGDIQKIYTEISSQPGRLLNDFRHLGFNEAENGKKVFDGHMQWIAAGNGINMNYRFSQTGRTERNRQNHLYIEGRFPFANVESHDPITRKTDSRYSRCEQTKTNTCPLGVEIYSANEYWVKAASLLHTDPTGSRDLADSPYTRNYFMSSMQHGTGNASNKGACQQFQNPLNSAPVQRALFIALDEWATHNRKPPESRVPTLKDETLAPPLPQSGMGFPSIPGVTYTGLKTTRYHFDYGHGFYETGIATINPPVISVLDPTIYKLPDSTKTTYQDNPANGPIYPSYIPTTDSDGNDIAGVRLPDVTVPLATYTGWALRAGAQADDGCEAAGQYIPFPRTKDDRELSNDPRQSVLERYPSFMNYYTKAVKAIDDMIVDRLLLCEDAQSELNRLVAHGLARGVPAPQNPVPAAQKFPHCETKRVGSTD